MHLVTIPKPVKLRQILDGKGQPAELGFFEFIRDTLSMSKLWRQAGWITTIQTIIPLFERKTKPGAIVEIEDEAWERLRTVIQNHDIDGRFVADVLPFIDAIVNAPIKPAPMDEPKRTLKKRTA